MSDGEFKNRRDNKEYKGGYEAGRYGTGGAYSASTFFLGETDAERSGREAGERDRAKYDLDFSPEHTDFLGTSSREERKSSTDHNQGDSCGSGEGRPYIPSGYTPAPPMPAHVWLGLGIGYLIYSGMVGYWLTVLADVMGPIAFILGLLALPGMIVIAVGSWILGF